MVAVAHSRSNSLQLVLQLLVLGDLFFAVVVRMSEPLGQQTLVVLTVLTAFVGSSAAIWVTFKFLGEEAKRREKLGFQDNLAAPRSRRFGTGYDWRWVVLGLLSLGAAIETGAFPGNQAIMGGPSGLALLALWLAGWMAEGTRKLGEAPE